MPSAARTPPTIVPVAVLGSELAAVSRTERFLNEIKVTANLSHPHILPLLDSGKPDRRGRVTSR